MARVWACWGRRKRIILVVDACGCVAVQGGRIESATALNSLCVAGGPAIRLKAPTVGLLVPTLELCEAGMQVNDAFMSMHSDSATEKSRLEVWLWPANAPVSCRQVKRRGCRMRLFQIFDPRKCYLTFSSASK